MMQINGKTYFRIDDAVKEFGFDASLLKTQAKMGEFEAERIDNEWFITEPGMVKLRRIWKRHYEKKTPVLVTMDAPDEVITEQKRIEPIPESTIDKTHGSNGQSVHFTSEHHQKILSKVRTLANDLGVSIKEMTVCLIEKGLESESLKHDLKELEELDNQRMNLLKRMRVKV